LVAAKAILQDARGKVLTGYRGLRDLYVLAEEIAALGEELSADMDRWDRRKRKRNADPAEG
jgi:hypothetical protein